jgi:uridine kinase
MSLLSMGRCPWFDAHGQTQDFYLIGIAGGSASGKTSVSLSILQTLSVPWVVLLSMDSFYKVLTPEQKLLASKNEYDFDHPDAFDYDSLFEVLKNLKQGIQCQVPIYDFNTHSRSDQSITVYGASVVLFEGIFALYDPRIRELMDLKLFVDTDADVRLARRCILLFLSYRFL